jgi:hypothetical protein
MTSEPVLDVLVQSASTEDLVTQGWSLLAHAMAVVPNHNCKAGESSSVFIHGELRVAVDDRRGN